MSWGRVRYELRIETVVSPATLATFRVPVEPTAVPRRTVHRLRVPADRDLTEVVDRLTARDVELLEIRRCDEAAPRPRPEPDVLDRRGPREQALRGAQHRAPVGALVVVPGLERPDPLAQPGQEPPPLGEPAEQRLPEVDVPLDQPRQHPAAGGVEGADARRRLGHPADRADPAVLGEQVRLDDGGFRVERDQRAAADEERSGPDPGGFGTRAAAAHR